MKTTFDKTYIMANRGCYERDQVDEIPFKNGEITLKGLFDYLPIRDFTWFLTIKCELSTKEKQLFALHCASYVAPIYRKYYPNDSRVDDCIKATKQFLEGEITREALQEKRDAATAAYSAAYSDTASVAAAAAADAVAVAAVADDAVAVAAAAAVADAVAVAAAAAAAAADDADAAAAYKNHLWEYVEKLINNNA